MVFHQSNSIGCAIHVQGFLIWSEKLWSSASLTKNGTTKILYHLSLLEISINLYYECNILNHKTKINWNNWIENLAEKFMSWRQTWLNDMLIYFQVLNTYCNVIFPPDNFRFWMCNILHVWWKGSVLYRKLTNRITGKYIWVRMGYKPLNILINTLSRTDSYEMRRVIREHKLLCVVFFGH